MKVAGSAVIGVRRDRLWAAFHDPEVLVRTIPGCERLEETGADTYRMTVNAGVASLKGVYHGEVALSDPLAPESLILKARGQGAPGTVEATVQVRLTELDGATRVDYDAEAVIGGMIAGVGQRLLSSAARRTATEFFTTLESHLHATAEPSAAYPAAPGADGAAGVSTPPGLAPVPVAAAVQGPAAAGRSSADAARGGAVYERPPKPHAETRPWITLASFGMGAGIALAGVAVGWLLGRDSRHRSRS
ncbi:MAG TPA: carbon monoxide dehydrogenase subunit G [Nonomuraea sp.]|nr:carbon monoxide dehydrogenase subunit G [Nonomuraea sp.]